MNIIKWSRGYDVLKINYAMWGWGTVCLPKMYRAHVVDEFAVAILRSP